MKPTIILTHGAYADSSSWNGVIEPLTADGHRVIAGAGPLRCIATDAGALSDLVRSVEGPVVPAVHSYGGAVMTNVDPDAGDVVALVFVAGFALEPGASPGDASSLAPGSALAETLERVPLADGEADTYIAHDKFHHQFAADLPVQQSALMAVTQRPVTEAALFESSGDLPDDGTPRSIKLEPQAAAPSRAPDALPIARWCSERMSSAPLANEHARRGRPRLRELRDGAVRPGIPALGPPADRRSALDALLILIATQARCSLHLHRRSWRAEFEVWPPIRADPMRAFTLFELR